MHWKKAARMTAQTRFRPGVARVTAAVLVLWLPMLTACGGPCRVHIFQCNREVLAHPCCQSEEAFFTTGMAAC